MSLLFIVGIVFTSFVFGNVQGDVDQQLLKSLAHFYQAATFYGFQYHFSAQCKVLINANTSLDVSFQNRTFTNGTELCNHETIYLCEKSSFQSLGDDIDNTPFNNDQHGQLHLIVIACEISVSPITQLHPNPFCMNFGNSLHGSFDLISKRIREIRRQDWACGQPAGDKSHPVPTSTNNWLQANFPQHDYYSEYAPETYMQWKQGPEGWIEAEIPIELKQACVTRVFDPYKYRLSGLCLKQLPWVESTKRFISDGQFLLYHGDRVLISNSFEKPDGEQPSIYELHQPGWDDHGRDWDSFAICQQNFRRK
jgi:hypothetical protein